MREFITDQRNMFFISLALGVAMGIVYDALRCLRRIIPHNNFFIAIEDIAYWIFFAYVVIDSIHKYNYGSIRGYVFFGIILGAAIYLCTISCLLMYLVSHILWFVKKTSKKINNMLKKRIKKGRIILSLSKRNVKK